VARKVAVVVSLSLGAIGCSEEADRKPSAQPGPPAARPAGAARYAATPEEGIRFFTPGLPDFVADMSGFSVHESWGRWTVGPLAEIRFARALPQEFDLVVTGSAYGPNVGKPVAFACGQSVQEAVFSSELGKGSDTHRLGFKTAAGCDKLEIRIPSPTVPPPESGDGRALGIALSSLKFIGK
jgi:phosphoglycerol transferase